MAAELKEKLKEKMVVLGPVTGFNGLGVLGLGIWVGFVWVWDQDLDWDFLRGLKVYSESLCVLANSSEHKSNWSFLDCVFGLGSGWD